MTTIQQARRVAKRAGFRVCKSRDRSQHWNNRGQLQLIDDRNCVVLGVNFESSPEDSFMSGTHKVSGARFLTIPCPNRLRQR